MTAVNKITPLKEVLLRVSLWAIPILFGWGISTEVRLQILKHDQVALGKRVDNLPPHHLLEDIKEIKDWLRRLEAKIK